MHRDDLAALFPDKPALTSDDIARRMGGLRFTGSDDERLHFEMLAPRGWTWRDPAEAKSPPGVLLSLVDESPGKAEISVTADELSREVSPAEWVKNRLERAGHSILAERQEYGAIGAFADVLTEAVGPEGRLLARTNMVKDAGRIFSITCAAREDVFPKRADEFFGSLASFKLLHPENAPLAEPLSTFTELYPAVFGFRYPASWRLVEEVAGTEEACDVRLDNFDGERCAGRIYVHARAAEQPRKLVSGLFARLEQAGIRALGRPDLAPEAAPEGFLKASSLVSPATYQGDKMEIRAVVLEIEGLSLLLALGGPARAMSADWWAINKRAFEIVRASVYAT
jgi:hypothetical protein